LNPQNEPAINLRNQTQTALQQSSIVEMIENLSEEKTQGTQQAPAGQQPPSGQQPPTSQPPPPAASKLPPLEGASPQGPTTTPAQNPTGSTPSTSLPEDRLAPLPPQ
jgi:hypothetical protein